MDPQSALQTAQQAGHVQAVAAVGQISRHMANDAMGRIHGQAAEVVQGPGFAGFDGNARVRVGGAVVGLVAEQAGFFVLRAGYAGMSGKPGLMSRQVAQLVGRGRHHGRRRHSRRLIRGQKWTSGARRPLFQHRFQRGVGLDRRRVNGLRLAGHQAPGHTLGKNVVEQALKDGGREELAGAAHRRMPGQLFVHFVAQEIQDVQAQGAVFDQTAVADQVFQPAHQHELEEDHRVERGLARVAVKAPGFIIEKRPVDQLGQPAIQVMRRDPFGEPKAGHLLVEVLLFALHPFSTNR